MIYRYEGSDAFSVENQLPIQKLLFFSVYSIKTQFSLFISDSILIQGIDQFTSKILRTI